MRVLITCGALEHVAGVQAYVRDLAGWLLARGHAPIVYGPRHGRVAAQLARMTVPVTDDLATIAVAPDIIHGNSSIETMTALLHFPHVPAVYVCHGFRADLRTPRSPRIARYVAVDDTCADRLLYKEAIPPEQLEVILNGVDTSRFARRATPLPPRPRRAAIFANAAHAATNASAIEQACARAGIDVEIIGEFAGTAVDQPEAILSRYDLVFAKGKCALESLASGAAVVVCHGSVLGGMVTSGNLARLRRLNFGMRSMSAPLTVDAVSEAIAAYDAADATKVSDAIRNTASSEVLHEQLLALYESVVEQGVTTSWEDESRAAAAYLRDVAEDLRPSDSNLNLVVQATHRLLRVPLVGGPLQRVARWIVHRGKA